MGGWGSKVCGAPLLIFIQLPLCSGQLCATAAGSAHVSLPWASPIVPRGRPALPTCVGQHHQDELGGGIKGLAGLQKHKKRKQNTQNIYDQELQSGLRLQCCSQSPWLNACCLHTSPTSLPQPRPTAAHLCARHHAPAPQRGAAPQRVRCCAAPSRTAAAGWWAWPRRRRSAAPQAEQSPQEGGRAGRGHGPGRKVCRRSMQETAHIQHVNQIPPTRPPTQPPPTISMNSLMNEGPPWPACKPATDLSGWLGNHMALRGVTQGDNAKHMARLCPGCPTPAFLPKRCKGRKKEMLRALLSPAHRPPHPLPHLQVAEVCLREARVGEAGDGP